MPKPSEFHIGVIEFFSILLPGALVTATLWASFHSSLAAPARELLAPAGAKWVAFALISYAAGHFVFLAGSMLDLLYDGAKLWAWFESKGLPLRERLGCWRKAFGAARENSACYALVTRERDAVFGDGGKPPMNNFAFAKSMLRLKAPAMLADVERYEADSKFFRSLVVAVPLVTPALLPVPNAVWGAFALAVASFLRYAERRYKGTEWAYRYLLVLRRLPSPDPPR